MKTYFVTMNGITVQVDSDGLARWIDYIIELGNVPHIEKVEEAA